jgi:hypothetical protein
VLLLRFQEIWFVVAFNLERHILVAGSPQMAPILSCSELDLIAAVSLEFNIRAQLAALGERY